MHRLKSWFGVKDWDGPSNEENQEPVPDPAISQRLEPATSTNTSTLVPITINSRPSSSPVNSVDSDQPVIVDPVLSRGVGTDLSTRVDLWLRQYVPVQPDECVSCKLIGTGVLAIAMLYGMRATYRLKKFVVPKTQKWYILGVVSFYGFATSVLYQRFTNTGAFEPKVVGEKSDERLERLLQQDINYYKDLLGTMRGKPVTKTVDDYKEK